MSPLTQAISQGYSAEQILEFLLRKFPKYSKDIQKALGQGYSANTILKYLSGGRKGLNEFEGELTEHEKTIKSDKEKQRNLEKNIGKAALGIGSAALGVYGLGRAGTIVPEVLPTLEGAIQPKEDVEIDLTPKIAYQQKQLDFQPPNQLIQQAKEPQVPPVAPTSPIQPQMPQVDFGQILDRLGVKNKVDALRENNSPDVISKVIRYGLPKEQIRQLESQIPLDQVISGYLQTAPAPETMQQKISKGADLSRSRPENIPEEKERGSSVLLPDGQLGEIESVKQGIAKVKVGDKIRNKKLDELMQSPKEAAVAALELIKSFTPEHLRSAHHALNMYDPTTRSAQFLFHNGEGYIVEDISPEEYERLSNELDAAKTSGESPIAAWATGGGSRGAAYNKIVKKLNKPYRKIMVGYNLFKEFQRLINEKEE